MASAVLRLGLAGALAQGGLEPPVVGGVPGPVGPHLLEHRVHEPHQVDLVGGDADAVGLVGEGGLVGHDGVRVLGGQAREHRVVAGDRVDLDPPGA